jgi:ribosomal protein S18 acetylase RimI-like enzyme
MIARTVRLARPDEAELVRSISAEAYVPAYRPVIGDVPQPAREDYSQRIGRGEVWLLENAAAPVGVLVLDMKDDHALVYSVAVRPSEQRKGHARFLLAFAERQARKTGRREVRLYTNPRMTGNVGLYRSCGYRETGTRPHPSRAGERLVDMAKRLDEEFAKNGPVMIRPVGTDERVEWERLWRAFQAVHEFTVSDETIDVTWQRFHDPAEPMFLLGGYVDGALCGIAQYVFHRSCTTIGDFCFLHNLFVADEARGHGVGRALVEAVYAAAERRGASRVLWNVLESNAAARALYDRVAMRSGFIQYRKDIA